MNPWNILNHIKVEKPNLIKLITNNQTHIRLKNPNIFFRVFEIFLIIAVTSRLMYEIQPPISLVLTVVCESLYTLSLLVLSPPFIFILGNVIVVTLFIKSPHYNGNVKRPKCPSNVPHKDNTKIAGPETIVATIFHGEQAAVAAERFYRRTTSDFTVAPVVNPAGPAVAPAVVPAVAVGGGLRRARSSVEIRRSSKGYCRNYSGSCGVGCRKTKVGHYPEDHMSNEEFKRTIEDFIAKQQRILREEHDLISALD